MTKIKISAFETKHARLKEKMKTARQEFEEFEAGCPHENWFQNSSHISGGYDYKSEHIHWDECNLCGVCRNVKITYGSFQ